MSVATIVDFYKPKVYYRMLNYTSNSNSTVPELN